jgi:predicted transcriptional regulator
MSEKSTGGIEHGALLELTTRIVSAYASNAKVSGPELLETITSVSRALSAVGNPSAEPEKKELVAAVPIKKSVTPDFIICLEDGKKLKMLKRHLMSTYNMTPDQYRAKWSLPSDYPMVAPKYARTRSELAKKIGLGRPVAPQAAAPVAAPEPPPKRTRGQKKPAQAPAEQT